MSNQVRITECPRDAMQGIMEFIPTDLKIRYHNALLKCGFETLDFGSFVSPKAVPQLADTAEVVEALNLDETETKLLSIIANRRGAEDACKFEQITYLGYPFSISETFQMRNTRKSISESLDLVKEMVDLADLHGKELLIYISMGFGNPYGDPWSPEIAEEWVDKMAGLGIRHLAMADTVGSAEPESISSLFNALIPRFPEMKIGAHFHASPEMRIRKIQAAWDAGCRDFDTALNGFGGCPFAEDELVGNISTESLLAYCADNAIGTGIKGGALNEAMSIAGDVFGSK